MAVGGGRVIKVRLTGWGSPGRVSTSIGRYHKSHTEPDNLPYRVEFVSPSTI